MNALATTDSFASTLEQLKTALQEFSPLVTPIDDVTTLLTDIDNLLTDIGNLISAADERRIPETLTKNKDVNIVNLSESALDILRRRSGSNNALDDPSPFVFPGNGKE
ncbi:MAG TPA: hypothetical protein VF609_16585, partial [Flavisolibacter sp.]